MSSEVTNIASVQTQTYLQGQQVFSRKEAKSRLHTLTPNSEEYSKLQSALIGRTGVVEISLPNFLQSKHDIKRVYFTRWFWIVRTCRNRCSG